MCGRFTITVTFEELLRRFLIDGPSAPFHTPRYNVAPTQMVPAIIHDGEKRRLGELRWGLIPPWGEDERIGARLINARAETLPDKPAFRKPLERKRCLIPADGFYEWKEAGGRKQPMRIVLKNGGLFAMAGLYETWARPDGTKVHTCAVITTAPNELMREIHDRMPAILRPEDEHLWLDRRLRDTELLQSLLKPYPAEEMRAYPVSPLVGNPRNDTPACIEPVNPDGND